MSPPSVNDLRRTVVRDLIRSGVSQTVAMKQTGHVTVSMFNRYDIGTEEDLIAAAEARDRYLAAQPASNVVTMQAR